MVQQLIIIFCSNILHIIELRDKIYECALYLCSLASQYLATVHGLCDEIHE